PLRLARLNSVATVPTETPRRLATWALLNPLSRKTTTCRSRKLSFSAPRISTCTRTPTSTGQVIHRLWTNCGQTDDKNAPTGTSTGARGSLQGRGLFPAGPSRGQGGLTPRPYIQNMYR